MSIVIRCRARRLFWLMLAPWSAFADANITNVTPSNITSQPLRFRVEADPIGQEGVQFDVFVGAGSDSITARAVGQLEIGESTLRQTSPNRFVTEPPKMWCNLGPQLTQGMLRYSFRIPREWLGEARFQFQNHQVPQSMDLYRLPLKAFAPKQ